jgi:hypothetical protein
MITLSLTPEDAFNHVQSRRFCCSPNPSFFHQIEAYRDIWDAGQISSRDGGLNSRGSDVRRKREVDDEGDDDEEEIQRAPDWGPTRPRTGRKVRPLRGQRGVGVEGGVGNTDMVIG